MRSHKYTAESSVGDLKLPGATAWGQIPRLPFPNTVVFIIPQNSLQVLQVRIWTLYTHLEYSFLSQCHLTPLQYPRQPVSSVPL